MQYTKIGDVLNNKCSYIHVLGMEKALSYLTTNMHLNKCNIDTFI